MDKLKTLKNSFEICSKASDSACYSASLFTIGNALHNCVFYDELGTVHTNLSFMHIVPSSGYKSPLLQVLIEIYEKEFKEQGIQYQSKFTTEGLMNSLFKSKQEWEKENKLPMPIQKIHAYRDEASNLAKESKAGRSANMWEFLSESYDGKIRPYNTIRGGYQTYPEVWMSFWFASTLTLYEQLTDDFWEQGFAFRCLFIKPEETPFTGFNLHNNQRDLEIQRIINEIIELRDVKYAVPSDDWALKYNEFIKPIHDRGNEEIKKLNSADTTGIEDKSDKKYPEMVIKLSMIHCASRGGWKTDDEGKKYLYLEMQDIEMAIIDLEIYKENFIQAYNSYVFKKSESIKIEKFGKERERIFKLFDEINLPQYKKYHYNIEYKKLEDGVTHAIGVQSDDGDYVSRSYFASRTQWTKGTLNGVLSSMEDAVDIEIISVDSVGTNKKTQLINDMRNGKPKLPEPPEKESKGKSGIISVDTSKLSPELKKKLHIE